MAKRWLTLGPLGIGVINLQRVPPAEAGSEMKDRLERGAEAPHYPYSLDYSNS